MTFAVVANLAYARLSTSVKRSATAGLVSGMIATPSMNSLSTASEAGIVRHCCLSFSFASLQDFDMFHVRSDRFWI